MEQVPTTTTTDELQSTCTDKSQPSNSNRKDYLTSLYKRGGFVIACETVITLHKITSDTTKWEIVGYGILAILAKGKELSLFVGDVHSGELKHEFALGTSSKYSLQKDHFHTFLSADGDFCGLSFVDTCIAQKMYRVISQLLPKGDEMEAPPTKRHKLNGDYDDWVVINSEDVPKIVDSDEATEKGVDEPDFSFFKKEKKKFTVDDISGPSYFRRTSLGGTEQVSKPSVSEASGKQDETQESVEMGTKRSSSFVALEATAPIEITKVETTTESAASGTHDASSTSELASRSSFTSMSSYTSSNFSLPEPPEYLGSHDALLYQINTFDRRRMHHVTEEEVSETRSHEESQSTMLSILQSGFNSMLPKLQAMCPTVATVNSSGEEDGFDDFDGLLFE